MEKVKQTKKIISLILTFLILFSVSATPISLAAEMLNSTYYKIDNSKNMISRVEPETKVEEFKTKMNADESDLTIYQDKTCVQEVTTGFVGTGMALKYDGKVYEISVVGDFDKDGKATQVELTNIIRHIVGLAGAELTGIYYESADLTGDGLVDQRDITKYIRYIVYGELDLGKEDTTPPILTLNTKNVQASSATVVATALDKETGMGDNPTFTFYLKKANEPDTSYVEVQKGTNNEFNMTGLISNTEYEVKVVTQDKVGNKAEKTITFTTEKISGDIVFGDVTWTSGLASITISTSTSYTIEYQVNGTADGAWQTIANGAAVTNLNHNDVVYARLVKETEYTDTKSKQIKDTVKPNVTLNLSSTTSEIEVVATATDNETGIDIAEEYVFYVNGVEKQRNTTGTYKFTGLTSDTSYMVKVEIKDKAGNVGYKEQSITTLNVPSASQPGNIMFSNATWSGGKAQVTITTNTSYTIEYQVNGTTGTWTAGTTVTNLKHGDVVYARLTDGANAGSYISQTIYDSIAPNVTLNLVPGTQEITATATATDNESGIPTNVTYKFSIKETGAADSTYVVKQNTTSNICSFTGLVDGKDYTIKVEVQDNAGNTGIKEESKEIPDNVAPEVTLSVTNKTSNSITAEASATDVGGMPASPTYVFYIKKTGDPDSSYTQIQSSSSTTCTFTGLQTNTDYTIKVTVQDDAGNEGMKEVSCLTDRIPSGTDVGAITFSNITWTSGKAQVTISTNTSYTIEYQVNGTLGTWVAGTTVSNLNHGDVIYARLTDGTNATSPATLTVVDANKPQVTLSLTQAISSITATATATDNESGIASNVTYKFSIKEAGEADTSYVVKQNTTSNTCAITGLIQGTNYVVKVEVQDVAGNVGEQSQTTTTLTMPDATLSGALSFSKVVWSSGKASTTMSTTTSFDIEYQVNSTSGTWLAGTSVSNLNHGDVVYARLTDGTNASNYVTLNVVDTVAPESFTIAVTDLTYEGFKITGSTADLESGIKDYTYVVTKAGTKVKEVTGQTVTSYTIDGLDAETEYVVYILAYDNVGNERKSDEVTVKTEKEPISRMFGQYVDYEIDIDGNTNDYDWQIFYKEEDPDSPNYGATYIIADYYVPYVKMKKSIANAGMMLYSSTIYGVCWLSAPTYQTISDTVKQVFMYDYTGTSNPNVCAISRLLNTDNWKDDFVTAQLQAKGGMAIGSPTINMWCASWNKAYSTQKITPSISGYGYKVNGTNLLDISSYTGYTSAPNVYFPTKTPASDGIEGYLLANPSSVSFYALAGITYNGKIIYYDQGGNDRYYFNDPGMVVRPVVYLPPSVTLTKDATTPNLWNINY